MGISAVTGSALSCSQISKPLMSGSTTSSTRRSGGAALMLAMAALPSETVSACMPSATIMRASRDAISASSSTISTRNAACAGVACAAAARSLIRDFDFGEIVAVVGDLRGKRRLVGLARALLDVLADGGDELEAVGITDTAHAVADLAQ